MHWHREPRAIASRNDGFSLWSLPCHPPEQPAIAAFRTDMDDEVAAPGRRSDKAGAIRQGVMQQPLTGSVRLPVPDDEREGEPHDA